MSWEPVFSVQLASYWQYSPSIEGELFRISYFLPTSDYGRIYLCQIETGDPLLHFGVIRIYPKAEQDLYHLITPECFSQRSLGVKCDYFSVISLTLFFDVWVSPMPISNPVTLVFPTSTTANSTTVASLATSTPVLAANPLRKGATIWNASTATLYLDLDAAATATDYAARLDPQGYYEVPFGFTGAVSGIWSAANGSALVREFV